MKMLFSVISIVIFLFSSGCSKSKERNGSIDFLALADSYAKEEGVDLSEYRPAVIREYKNGETSVLDRSNTDDYTISILKSLKNESYWEACYKTIEPMLGGGYCFYIDKKDGELLEVYRSQ